MPLKTNRNLSHSSDRMQMKYPDSFELVLLFLMLTLLILIVLVGYGSCCKTIIFVPSAALL